MAYLHFDKTQMTNLQESLNKEFLITNHSGAYCSSTLVGCNTRKYHGLFVVPIPEMDDENHVLLSSLDETIIQHGAEFNLGLHKYRGDSYSPKGHKYIVSFEQEKVPTWIYRIGGVLLKKEISYSAHQSHLYIRYTLLEAHSPTLLRLKPFLAFRSVRQWTHENDVANTAYEEIENGIKMCLYKGYPTLHMQLTAKPIFHYEPNWYLGLEYPKERERGYDSTEDLLVPGFFELPITKGESIIFSAALEEGSPKDFHKMMETEIEPRTPLDSFYHCLVHAAHQFRYKKDDEDYLLAGYHWFKPRARDTFIAMPGLTLAIGEQKQFEKYMSTAQKAVTDFLKGESITGLYEIEQPDILLWCVWCLQQYAKYTSRQECYKKYGLLIKQILLFIYEGKHPNLFVHENGLLYANGKDRAVTWMNATVDGKPIIPRSGYIVEINALWYNALKFYEQLVGEQGTEDEKSHVDFCSIESQKIETSFKKVFLNDYGYLLDYVDGQMMDWSVRPNQLFAIALDFSPLNIKERKGVLDICTKELVTPKGIRSLSPKSGGYNPMYIGEQRNRDYAYFSGTAWPWLTGFYLEAYVRVYKMSGVNYIERQLIGVEDELFYRSIGTRPERFDGNPQFSGRGAVSFAMNVSGILRAIRLLEKYKQQGK